MPYGEIQPERFGVPSSAALTLRPIEEGAAAVLPAAEPPPPLAGVGGRRILGVVAVWLCGIRCSRQTSSPVAESITR